MSEKKLLSRVKFDEIVYECLAILVSRGFTFQIVPGSFSRSSEIFENICFGFFGDVEPIQNFRRIPKIKADLTQKKLDKITLECALVFIKRGVEGVHFNESLNTIRSAIADSIEAMGYEFDADKFCMASKPGWGCYKLWEEVAKRGGLSEGEIVKTRKWFKKELPNYYEE